MLNELYTLARSLKCFNVTVEAAHPWVKRLGRADLLVAGVDAAGFVATVEYFGKQTAVTLFKIQESNHSNFPAVNWPSPVWKLDRESAAVQEWLACPTEQLRLRVELLRKAYGAAEISPGQDRALSRVQGFCRELAPRFQVSDDGGFAAFSALLERLLAVTTSAEEWLRKLSDSALGSAEAGSAEMLVLVETLLAGKFDRKKNQLQKAKVPILFDLADCTKFRHRVASPKFGGYFSQHLNATDIAGTGNGRCALTGLDMPIETDKMPSPRLPVLGDTVLMSMNPDTPCQARYGRIGTEIFPLGKKTASDLNSALLHLTAEDRKGKNWMPVPGTAKKKFNLLLVYLEASPLLEAEIAEMFSGADESDALYTTICARVSEALGGRATRDSNLLHLFVLNKIDPGRVQVELNEDFTAEQVIRGCAEWEGGSWNRPALVLQDDDFVPSPTDVMKCLRMKWERSGGSYSEAPGCRLADVYQLLIAEAERARDSANHVLRMTLHRSADLLKAVGHAAHRGGKEAWKGISRDAGKNPIIAASLLGITLNGNSGFIVARQPPSRAACDNFGDARP